MMALFFARSGTVVSYLVELAPFGYGGSSYWYVRTQDIMRGVTPHCDVLSTTLLKQKGNPHEFTVFFFLP